MQSLRLKLGIWNVAALFLASATPALAAPIETCSPPYGVITKCQQTNFPDYVRAVLNDDMKYIITAALIMIIASGVQYMLSGIGSADGQKQAKQRIIGILSGVFLLLTIDLILNQLGSKLSTF